MSSPFSSFLFLVLWKGKWVVCLEVEPQHHFLLIKNHCHQRSRHWFRELICFNRNSWIFNFFSRKIKNNMKENHSSHWIKHPILVSQIILIKNHSSRLLPKSLFMRNRNQSDYTDNSLGIKQALHGSRKYSLPPSYNPKAMQISLAPINISVCSVDRIQLISSRSA